MMNQTSEKAYSEYQKIRLIEEKLEKQNRGLNIINADKVLKSKRYYIEILKFSKINLLEESSSIILKTDFPFSDWRYHYNGMSIKDFLHELKKWVSIPKYNFLIQHNRKRDNKVSSWDLPEFRNLNILFENIDFNFGKLADKEVNLEDFTKKVKELLSQQREATDKEAKAFEIIILMDMKKMILLR